jgi:hypothetical protein
MRKLTKRERVLLFVLAIIAVGAVIYSLSTSSSDSANDKPKDADGGSEKIQKLERLADEYRRIRQDKTRIQALLDNKNENTTTLIQQWAANSNIDKNIGYTRRSQSNIQNKYVRVTTEIKIEGVAIQQFLKFLNDVENSNDLLRVQYIRISKALKGTDTYDVLLKIDSFTSNK